MKIIAIEVENMGVENEQYKRFLKEESKKVLDLYEKGIIREIYFNQFHCARLILECASSIEAEEVLSNLPLVSNGLIHFNICELNPYTGFSRLLEK